jgi:hypothetical protein
VARSNLWRERWRDSHCDGGTAKELGGIMFEFMIPVWVG